MWFFFLCNTYTFYRNLDEGLAEAISTIIWVAPRIQTDVQEIKVIADILTTKYGRQYMEACKEEAIQTISEKLKHKMSVQSPSKLLVEKYLIEIANNYNIEYKPDPQIMAEGKDALLIDIGSNNGDSRNNLDLASGGSNAPQPAGFIGFPQAPLLPDSNINVMVRYMIIELILGLFGIVWIKALDYVKIIIFLFFINKNSEKGTPPIGFVPPIGPATSSDKDQNTPFNPAAFSYNIPLDNGNINKPVSNKILINILYCNYI